MGTARRPRAKFDGRKMVADMVDKAWAPRDLARAAGVSDMSVSRFLRGEVQTERMAGCLSRALGYSPRRYFLRVEAA